MGTLELLTLLRWRYADIMIEESIDTMPKIIIEQPGISDITYVIESRETSFGRAEDNSVVLVAEEVSRHHARIRLKGAETILEDLKSLNGTYVNRQRIVQRILSDKDEIWLGGKCRVVFQDDSEEVLKQRGSAGSDSELSQGLKLIQKEMEDVSATMTMMGTPIGLKEESTQKADAPKLDEAEFRRMSRAFRRLDAIYQASKVMASDFVLEKRMEQMVDLAINVMGADRGFLMLKDEEGGTLGTSVARGMGQELEENSPSMTIARRSAFDGEPILMADSGVDDQLGSRNSIIRQNIIAAMCVPVRIEDRILGALYVDSHRFGVRFAEEDLELLHAIASQSAMALENVRLYEKMVETEKKRASLGRFLSANVVDLIMSDDSKLELGGSTKLVTTLFCDIRDFTPMAERLESEKLIELLNEHFTAMTEIVFQHGGTLDKFVGDEVMALFGAPLTSDNDAEQAVLASIAMQHKNAELNATRDERGLPEILLGIGVNTGNVVAGFVGSPDRMDFTVLGDQVNVASRLCSMAEGGQIVVGDATHECVEDLVESRPIGTTMLKGKKEAVYAYEVIGLLESSAPQPTSKEA